MRPARLLLTATDASGIVENEICPVFAGPLHPDAQLVPNSGEVMDWRWTPWEQLVAAITATPFVFSPWAVAEVRELPGRPSPDRPARTERRLPDAYGARPPTTDGDDSGPPHLTTSRPPTVR